MIKISETMEKIFEKIRNEKGISLVELVVAVTIFSMIVTIASGMFINAIRAQKIIIAKQSVADDLRYSADFMLKELRMAQSHPTVPIFTFRDSGGDQLIGDNSPSSFLSFFNSSGDNIKYSLSSGVISRDDGSTVQPISSSGVEIVSLNFTLNNWNLERGAVDALAPLITVTIRARSRNGAGGETEFQTSVSPRIY